MTKTRQSTLAITATILLKILTAENGGNSGSDSRDKISNTAAPIQPNPFWFWVDI